MCCFLKEEILNNIRQRAKNGKIVVYKAVTVNIRKGEPYVRSEIAEYTWHIGTNISYRYRTRRRFYRDHQYDCCKPSGIHGFTNKREAQQYISLHGFTFVPIVCDIKDLITAGTGSAGGPTRYQAVFLKAELTQAAWDEFIVPAAQKFIDGEIKRKRIKQNQF